jgi:transcriptional regulator with XRE-family HTH domain
MLLLQRFGRGLLAARKKQGMTQEDFGIVSSRTYLSSLERGLKSPTISKIEELASVLKVHPLTLVALAYLPSEDSERKQLWNRVHSELETIRPAEQSSVQLR